MRFTWQRDGLVILTVLTVLVLAPAGRGDDKKKADGDGAEKKPPVRAQEPDQEKKPTEIERFMELQLRQELLQERMRTLASKQELNDADSAASYVSASDYGAYDPNSWLLYSSWYGYPWFGLWGHGWLHGVGACPWQVAGNGNGFSPAMAASSGGGIIKGPGATQSGSQPTLSTPTGRLQNGNQTTASGGIAGSNLKVRGTRGAHSSGGQSSIRPSNSTHTSRGVTQSVASTSNAPRVSAAGTAGVTVSSGHNRVAGTNPSASPSGGMPRTTYSSRPAGMGTQGTPAMHGWGGFNGGWPAGHPGNGGGGMGGMYYRGGGGFTGGGYGNFNNGGGYGGIHHGGGRR